MRVRTRFDIPKEVVFLSDQFPYRRVNYYNVTYIIGGRSSKYLWDDNVRELFSEGPEQQYIPITWNFNQSSFVTALQRFHPTFSFSIVVNLRPCILIA